MMDFKPFPSSYPKVNLASLCACGRLSPTSRRHRPHIQRLIGSSPKCSSPSDSKWAPRCLVPSLGRTGWQWTLCLQDLHKTESLAGSDLSPSPLSCCDRVPGLRCMPTLALHSTGPLFTTPKVHTFYFYVQSLD